MQPLPGDSISVIHCKHAVPTSEPRPPGSGFFGMTGRNPQIGYAPPMWPFASVQNKSLMTTEPSHLRMKMRTPKKLSKGETVELRREGGTGSLPVMLKACQKHLQDGAISTTCASPRKARYPTAGLRRPGNTQRRWIRIFRRTQSHPAKAKQSRPSDYSLQHINISGYVLPLPCGRKSHGKS